MGISCVSGLRLGFQFWVWVVGKSISNFEKAFLKYKHFSLILGMDLRI